MLINVLVTHNMFYDICLKELIKSRKKAKRKQKAVKMFVCFFNSVIRQNIYIYI